MAKIILDAGHGGQEPGAVYEGRREKDDTLRLALAVGRILEDNGVDVAYTRTEDVYDTPYEKAQIANREGGDFLVSIHRNSSPQANQYSGVETLVFSRSGEKVQLAENINQQLAQVGFRDLGVKERPGLVILRRSRMPAVLVEAGFLNTEADNALFDEQFDEVAQAIANGILETLDQEEFMPQRREVVPPDRMAAGPMSGNNQMPSAGPMSGNNQMPSAGAMPGNNQMPSAGPMSGNNQTPAAGTMFGNSRTPGMWTQRESSGAADSGEITGTQMEDADRMSGCPCQPSVLYRVQTGAFRNREYAEDLLYQLLSRNFPAYVLREDNYYKVQVGAFRQLDNAVRMEKALRRQGYSTFITT